MLSRDWRIPWDVVKITEEVKRLMKETTIQVVHKYRETNKLVDVIASIVILRESMQQYNAFSLLPSMARKILNMDKQQGPSLRIRSRRITDKSMHV